MLTHARQTKAGRVPARLGRAVSTHRAPEGARQWAGLRYAVLGEAGCCMVRLGSAGRSKHTAAYGPLQFARRCSALRGLALPGAAGRGKHTAAYGPLQFARQCLARQGGVRQSAANTQRLTGRCSLAWLGMAWQGGAGRGKYIRLITGQFYDKQI